MILLFFPDFSFSCLLFKGVVTALLARSKGNNANKG
jgi:hypothetical protein